MRKSFKLENLDCANCAAKMEEKINEMPEVNKATVSFMTCRLTIDAAVDSADAMNQLVDEAQKIVSSFEKDCVILR